MSQWTCRGQKITCGMTISPSTMSVLECVDVRACGGECSDSSACGRESVCRIGGRFLYLLNHLIDLNISLTTS